MTEQDPRGDQLHAAAATQVSGGTPPPVPSMTAWGRRAALSYLVVGGLVLVGMAVETVLGHSGTFGMFAAFLSVPWSMLVAGFAPPLPANLPMALGLAARMAPLALFMLLNAAIVAGIAARSERDLTGRGAKALLLLLLAGALSSGCLLTSKQVVMVAAPTNTTLFVNGGIVTTLLDFDLATVPEWRDSRASLEDVTELSLMGDFGNPTDPLSLPHATDLLFWVEDTGAKLPNLPTGPQLWGPLHLEVDETHRVGWHEGSARFSTNRDALRRAIKSDGMFTLVAVSVMPPGSLGGAAVENLRLGATLQVK